MDKSTPKDKDKKLPNSEIMRFWSLLNGFRVKAISSSTFENEQGLSFTILNAMFWTFWKSNP